MAAARTRKNSKKADTRALNFQPNNLPEHVVFVAFVDGEEVGPVAIPQNKKLSENGNITFKGGIAGGWELEGEPNATLESISYVLGDVTLKASSDGAHPSGTGNPTIFHGATIEIKGFDGVVSRHRISVWTTYSEKDSSYSLNATTMPVAAGRARGPQVVGQVGAGFVLRSREVVRPPVVLSEAP